MNINYDNLSEDQKKLYDASYDAGWNSAIVLVYPDQDVPLRNSGAATVNPEILGKEDAVIYSYAYEAARTAAFLAYPA
jgi:hypothetical protein